MRSKLVVVPKVKPLVKTLEESVRQALLWRSKVRQEVAAGSKQIQSPSNTETQLI